MSPTTPTKKENLVIFIFIFTIFYFFPFAIRWIIGDFAKVHLSFIISDVLGAIAFGLLTNYFLGYLLYFSCTIIEFIFFYYGFNNLNWIFGDLLPSCLLFFITRKMYIKKYYKSV
jgi:hypothetical protein